MSKAKSLANEMIQCPLRLADCPECVVRLAWLASFAEAKEEFEMALLGMVYVHPCQCGDGIPEGTCARCRAVETLGFDPAVVTTEGASS